MPSSRGFYTGSLVSGKVATSRWFDEYRGTLPLLLGASLFTGLFFAVILRPVA